MSEYAPYGNLRAFVQQRRPASIRPIERERERRELSLNRTISTPSSPSYVLPRHRLTTFNQLSVASERLADDSAVLLLLHDTHAQNNNNTSAVPIYLQPSSLAAIVSPNKARQHSCAYEAHCAVSRFDGVL